MTNDTTLVEFAAVENRLRRDLAEIARSVDGAIDAAPTGEGVETIAVVTDFDEYRRRRARGWYAAAFAAAASAVALVVGLNAFDEGSAPAPVVTDVTTTTAPGDDTAPAPVAPPSDTTELAWSSLATGPLGSWAGSSFALIRSGSLELSSNGKEWTDSQAFSGDGFVQGVDGWDDTMVAWGWEWLQDRTATVPKVMVSRDGGSTWDPVLTEGLPPPPAGSSADGFEVAHAAVVEGTIVVVGTTPTDPLERSLYRSTLGGPFEVVDFNPAVFVDSLLVVDGEFVFVGSGPFFSSRSVYASADGENWTVSPLTGAGGEFPEDGLGTIFATNTALFAMHDKEVVRSTDRGQSWQEIPTPEGTTGIVGAGPGGVVLAGAPGDLVPADVEALVVPTVERNGFTVRPGYSNLFDAGSPNPDLHITDADGATIPSPTQYLVRGECPVEYEVRNRETDEVLVEVSKDDLEILYPGVGPDAEASSENRAAIAWSPDGDGFRWQFVDAGFRPDDADMTPTSVTTVVVGEDVLLATLAVAGPPRESDIGLSACGATTWSITESTSLYVAPLS